MRIMPTQAQVDYLSTIGVKRETLVGPPPGPPHQKQTTKIAPANIPGDSHIFTLIMLLIIVFSLVALAASVRGENTSATLVGASLQVSALKKTLPREEKVSESSLPQVVNTPEKPDGESDDKPIQSHVALTTETLPKEEAQPEFLSTAEFQNELNAFRGEVFQLQRAYQREGEFAANRLIEFSAFLRASTNGLKQMNRLTNTRASMNLRNLKIQIQKQIDEAYQHSRRTACFLALATLLLLALLLKGRLFMAKRRNQTEKPASGRSPQPVSEKCDNASRNKSAVPLRSRRGEKPVKRAITPSRPLKPAWSPPQQCMEAIVRIATEAKHIRVKPQHPKGNWSIGLATAKGNVRSENQDYGLCFQIDDNSILIVGDGLGGVPHGQQASCLAVTSAAMSMVRFFGMSSRWLHTPDILEGAKNAMKDAAHKLAVEGDKLNIAEIRDGLRTTLIVVIANKAEMAYAYIGDGGGCILRETGVVESFLTPQKASEHALNVLAASLGPRMEGDPVTGRIKRIPGDLIVVGSDGVFDRVGPEFSKDVLSGCIHYEGNLQKTADHIIEELAACQDEAGYVCDDNITIGIIGDGSPPPPPESNVIPVATPLEKSVQIPAMEVTK